jgi:crossover junction endodeoxyribonuclease RuvC
MEALTKKTFYLGIDPGFDGALSVIDDTGRALVFDAPTLTVVKKAPRGKMKTKREYALPEVHQLLHRFSGQDVIAVIEQTSSRPGQGVVSMWTQGYGVGVWEMALAANAIPFTRVNPRKWKNAMLQGVGTDKDASMLRAQQLFPHVELLGPKGGAKDGRAEALLLAEYARRERMQGRL